MGILNQIQDCAQAARDFASGLVSKAVQAMADDVEALGAAKQDKGAAAAVTLPAGSWNSDGTAGYPYYCDLAAAGVTGQDRAEVSVGVAGLPVAAACGLCPVCETRDGMIRFRSVVVPAADIPAEYWIEKGKE